MTIAVMTVRATAITGHTRLRIRLRGRLAPECRLGACGWPGISSPEVSRLNTVSMDVSLGAEPASSSAMRPSVRRSTPFKVTGITSAAAACSRPGTRVLVPRRRVHGQILAPLEPAECERNHSSPAPLWSAPWGGPVPAIAGIEADDGPFSLPPPQRSRVVSGWSWCPDRTSSQRLQIHDRERARKSRSAAPKARSTETVRVDDAGGRAHSDHDVMSS